MNTARREMLKVCTNVLFTIIKETAHGPRPGTETFPPCYWLESTVWPVTRRDHCTADGILLLCLELRPQLGPDQAAFHIPETRQAQADGEAGNGHGGFTLSPLQVRMKSHCWGACTVLQKFIVVEAKRGYL